MAQAAPPRVRQTTWCFALQLQMPDFSTAEEVRDAFCSIFNDTQQAIPGLEDSSFSYCVPEGCFEHIRGYLHSSSKIAEASVLGGAAAQVALTNSIVLAVLAHQHDMFRKVHGSQQVVQAVLNLHPDFVLRNLVQLFP